VSVGHAYNPAFSENRDQEDHNSKPAWAIVHENLSQKNLSQKSRADGRAQGVDLKFKSQHHKKKEKKRNLQMIPVSS
jgi:hypothetical protein